MKYRKVLSRRAVLRASGISLGLPFLSSMLEESVYGQQPKGEASAISLMYGLGTPYFILDRGFEGPLRYYEQLVGAGKVALYTDVDMRAAADNPEDAQHHNGQPYLFSGYRTQLIGGNNVAPQGPSLHYEILSAAYPEGPPTAFRIIDTGIYFRRGLNYQYQRIYDREGRNAADFEDLASPLDFFDELFGNVPDMPQLGAAQRAERSIIDYLIPAYEKYTTGQGALPAEDVAILNNHLERVRQVERNLYSFEAQRQIEAPDRPSPPDVDYKVDGGNDSQPENVHRVSPAEFETAYQILADLFIAGLEMDRYRFGNLSLDSGGGHTHYVGPYGHPDDEGYAFDGNPHHDYHRLVAEDPLAIAVGTAHNYFIHKNIAQVLEKLDSKEFLGPTGGTLLDNSLIMIGSEVGTNHDVSRMLHAFAGGGGRFQLGHLTEARVKAIELYGALGSQYGLQSVGDGRDYEKDEPSILG